MSETATTHRMTWFVYTGGTNADGTRERIRRTASMRGTWPGYDVVCSCGDESHTGGAVRSYIENAIWGHKVAGLPLGS